MNWRCLNVLQRLTDLFFEIIWNNARLRNLWTLTGDKDETIGHHGVRIATCRLRSLRYNDTFSHKLIFDWRA